MKMRFLRSIKVAIIGAFLIAVLFSGFAGLGFQRTVADPNDVYTACFHASGLYFYGPPGTIVLLELVDPNGYVLVHTTSTIGPTGIVHIPVPLGLYPPNSTMLGIFPQYGVTFTFAPYSAYVGGLSADNCVGGRIGDGRINDGPSELGASLAAYCNADSGIDVYSIDKSTSEGTLAFSVSADEIASALDSAASGGSSVLVGEGSGDQLWAAPDGTLAVIGPDLNGEGKTYRFDFAGDRCG
jgi:hypothetical protein